MLAEFFALPLKMLALATGALGFSTGAFTEAAISGQAQTAALIIAFLAGVSEMLGQSVILVINRVALYRFLASLAFTGFTYVFTALAWALSAITVAPLTRLGVLTPNEIAGVIGVVSLAFAPRLLGVFSIAPYFGQALGNILEAFALALAVFGLHAGFGLPLAAAARLRRARAHDHGHHVGHRPVQRHPAHHHGRLQLRLLRAVPRRAPRRGDPPPGSPARASPG
mgnify:CR=1 FL=1